MARVFDCFTFFDELDLLEIRLHELAPVVDIFVLAESSKTFQGTSKPLVFEKNRDRFADFNERIRHIVVDDMPVGRRSKERENWRREFHQRNALISALGEAAPDDVILLSDVDEIPRATSVLTILKQLDSTSTVHCFSQTMYQFFLNFQRRHPWERSGTRLIRRQYLRSMQGLREVRPPVSNPLRSSFRWLSASAGMHQPIRRILHADAGWHFSSMGGIDALAQKLTSFSHIVRDRRRNPDWDPLLAASDRIKSARTLSKLQRVPIDDTYPAYLFENIDRFSHLVDNEQRIRI